MPPFLATNTTLSLQPRDELEAAQAANKKYDPFKVALAVLGILALNMLFMMIAYFVRARYHKKKALEQRKSKNVAMMGLFGGSQHVQGLNEDDFEDVDVNSEEWRKKGATR